MPVEPIHGADARHLYLYLKVRATPDEFPRREGMARKRPLQTSSERLTASFGGERPPAVRPRAPLP